MKKWFPGILLLILSISQINAQGWYIPAGFQKLIFFPNYNVSFNNHNYHLFEINAIQNYISVGPTGGTPVNIDLNNFKSIYSGEIVICESILNGGTLTATSWAQTSTNVNFNQTTITGPIGTSVQFTATSNADLPVTDSPNFYQSAIVESWFNNVTVQGTSGTYTFNIPSDAPVGNYSFYMKIKLANNTAFMQQLTINVTQPNSNATITTNPTGLSFSVDGQPYSNQQTFSWIPGSSHTLSTTSTQGGTAGILYLWNTWSDGGANSHTIITPSGSASYTANFNTQYYLTMNAGAGGSVTPTSTWYNAGQNVPIDATPNDGYVFDKWVGTGTGSYSGTTKLNSITMNGPITQSATFVPPSIITILTNPSGKSFTVDGQTYSSQKTFNWVVGSSHTISTINIQSGLAGIQYLWNSWSDGGANSHIIITPNSSTTYTANFTTQYYLTMNAGSGGSVTPNSAWYNSGQSVSIDATPIVGNVFNNWSGTGNGSYTGTTKSTSVIMNEPISQTANFTAVNGITVTTNPAGLSYSVDGQSYINQQIFYWIPGSSHTLSTTSTQGGTTGTLYLWNSWSDGGTNSHTITTPSGSVTYTTNFTTQYYLTMNAGSGGSVTPNSAWYNAGQNVTIDATPNEGYVFNNWTGSGTGSYSGTTKIGTITMNGPITQLAAFTEPSLITILTNPSGKSYTVDGQIYSSQKTFSWAVGSNHTITASGIQTGTNGIQYLWSSWSDAGAISHTITTPNSSTTYTANFTTQYYLTMTAGSGGTVNPNSAWYNSGQSVPIDATPATGNSFNNWSGTGNGSYTGITKSTSVIMNEPISQIANFTAINGITVTTNPAGLNFSVDGQQYSSQQIFNWTVGSSHTVSTNSTQSGMIGTLYIWSSWSDEGANSHIVITPNSPVIITANFNTQYYLTMNAGSGGTVKPNSAWYNAGQSVAIDAIPDDGKIFNNWAGTGTGSYTGTTKSTSVTMNGPVIEIASFGSSQGGITITATDLQPLTFGYQQINTSSSPRSYLVSGANLNSDLIITAPVGFQVSTNQLSGFANSITLVQSNGNVANTKIWVIFTPLIVQSYSGNIKNVSGGVSADVVVSDSYGTASTLEVNLPLSNPYELPLSKGVKTVSLSNLFKGTFGTLNYFVISNTDSSIVSAVIAYSNVPQLLLIPNKVGSCIVTIKAKDIDANGNVLAAILYDINVLVDPTEGVASKDQIPKELALSQNFPNPFNPTTAISYQLPTYNHVKLRVYDLLGREVATLVDEEKSPGSYKVTFNAQNLTSGIYFYQLKSGADVLTKKFILLK